MEEEGEEGQRKRDGMIRRGETEGWIRIMWRNFSAIEDCETRGGRWTE